MSDKFDLYLARFVEWMQSKGWSERTLESYSADVKFFLLYLQQETSAVNLTDIDGRILSAFQTYLYAYQNKRTGKRLALSSQHNKLVALRSFFRFLYESDTIFFDPSAALHLPKKGKSLPKGVMSEQQVQKLLDQPPVRTELGLRDRAILETLYATGMRNSELRNLAVYDVDLNQLQVTIRKGKNAKDRIVPLGEIAADFIKEYLLTVRPELSIDSNDFLFISKNGLQLTKANLVWIIAKYVRQAELKGHFTPHSLRHSCATHMLKHGADLRYIQELLGHASVATTQIYTRVEVHDLREMHRRYHPRERIDE